MSDDNNTGCPTAPENNTANSACNGTQATQSGEPYEYSNEGHKHATAPHKVQAKRWENLPAELKAIPNWCLADADKAPCLANDKGQLYNVSPVQGPWYTFEKAARLGAALQTPIGIIVPPGYTCIDCDIKDTTNRDKEGNDLAFELLTPNSELDHFAELVSYADTYAELSNSKKGLHLWVKGDIGEGVRSGHMEVYSRDRFIISTGNAVSELVYTNLIGVVVPFVIATQAKPIAERQSLIEMLTRGMGKTKAQQIDLEELPEERTDEQILATARGAHNADKFYGLYAGNWKQMGYTSQSEADFALLAMFTFYSPSNKQVRRLFRQTELGKREKAVKNDVYLNRSIRSIRSREAEDAHKNSLIDPQFLLKHKGNSTEELNDEYRKLKSISLNEFQNQFTDIEFIIEGVLERGMLIGMCGRTGSGKTAIGVTLSLAIASGQNLGKRDTTKGKVLYIAGENPSDVSRRFATMRGYYPYSDECGHDITVIDQSFVLDKQRLPELQEIIDTDKPSLVIIDTDQAVSSAKEENDNTTRLAQVKLYRMLSKCESRPTVLVQMHPEKYADRDNLVPRGASSVMNDLDGILCVWSLSRTVTEIFCHEHKWRGDRFTPISFKKIIGEIVLNRKTQLPVPIPMYTPNEVEIDIEAMMVNPSDQRVEHKNLLVQLIGEYHTKGEPLSANDSTSNSVFPVLNKDNKLPASLDTKTVSKLILELEKEGKICKGKIKNNRNKREYWNKC